MTKLELYDCTLREGEQAAGASFSLENRVELFQLLDDFGFDFIELGWPIASVDIAKSFELCRNVRKRAKITAFGSTSIAPNVEEDKNLRSVIQSRADYACIFGKTSAEQVEKQLRITIQENLDRIFRSVQFLSKAMPVFYDAEHYFDGFKQNKDYALQTLLSAFSGGAERLVLCDTNGGILPFEAEEIIRTTRKFLDSRGIKVGLGVHFHDDCGLALANAISSLSYVTQVQGTINGMGERVGNLNFSEFIPVYVSKLHKPSEVKLKNIKEVNEKAFRLAGVDIPEARPFVGDSAFAHKGGVHIDATNKGARGYEHENPEDFGNKRIVLLNTLGGTAGVIAVANRFGYNLDKRDPEVVSRVEKLFAELKDLEQRGYRLGALEAEQFLLIEKHFGNLREFFNLESYNANTEKSSDREVTTFSGRYFFGKERVSDVISVNGGPIDAAFKSLKNVLSGRYPRIGGLKLADYHAGIARSSAEESTMRTVVYFSDGEDFKTVGVDSNIIESGVAALRKGFNFYLNKIYKQ